MKHILKASVGVFFLVFPVGLVSAVSVEDNLQLQNNIESRLSDLHQAKAELDAAETDLAETQKNMTTINGRLHTFEEYQALRDRVQKDQTNIAAYYTEILGDLNYLKNEWSFLTPEEKDFVKKIETSLAELTFGPIHYLA